MAPAVAVLFDNYGPYHWTRVIAASRALSIVPIEICHRSAEYNWNRHENAPLQLQTLLSSVEGNDTIAPNRLLRGCLFEILEEVQPAAVAIPGWSTRASLAALEWCSACATPAILMSETTEWDEPRRRGKEYVKAKVISLFDAAVVGGAAHKRYLERLGMKPDSIFFGYDVVDNEFFASQAMMVRRREAEERERLGVPRPFFLASARFVPKKNLHRLLQAYAVYRSRSKPAPWDLVLLGDGKLREGLLAECRNLNVEAGKNVHFPGFIQYDDLPPYYGLANAFVHASTTEQWGLVVNEAMASGLPVMVSQRCGCAEDLVEDGVNGWAFDPYDVEDITLAMLRMHEMSQAERDRMGEASRTKVGAYDPSTFAQGLSSAVEKAHQSQKRGGQVARMLLPLLSRR